MWQSHETSPTSKPHGSLDDQDKLSHQKLDGTFREAGSNRKVAFLVLEGVVNMANIEQKIKVSPEEVVESGKPLHEQWKEAVSVMSDEQKRELRERILALEERFGGGY